MVILDTSFLFAYFQRNDTFHLQAKKLAEKMRGELIYVSFLVFQELLTLLTSRYSSIEAIKVAKSLLEADLDVKLLKIDEEYFDETMRLFVKLSPHRFSFVDVSLIILAKELDAKVLSFDQNLEKALA